MIIEICSPCKFQIAGIVFSRARFEQIELLGALLGYLYFWSILQFDKLDGGGKMVMYR